MKARHLLKEERKWTKGAWARNSKNEVVHIKKGIKWDLEGAVYYCYKRSSKPYIRQVQEYVHKNYKHLICFARVDAVDLGIFNDLNLVTFNDIRDILRQLNI